MAAQIILSQKGPLPITVNFNSPGDLSGILEISGSVWTQNANTMIGIQIQLDGQNIGQANIFSNTATTHRAVVPAVIPIKLSYGKPHTLVLSAATGTTSDFNDFFTAVIHF